MLYFDSTYLVRLYYRDPGFERVRELAATGAIACGLHGRAEVAAAFHRKVREGSLSAELYAVAMEEFALEARSEAFVWLPLTVAVVERVHRVLATLPASVFLRAADALHLACAAERGLREVYSNDQRLLAAATHFGLRGLDVI
jgi:predicted nucleic acid-binding protein